MRVDFQKTFIFPIDFNDFIKHWGSFGVTLGQLLAYECDFGTISVRLWGHFGITFGVGG